MCALPSCWLNAAKRPRAASKGVMIAGTFPSDSHDPISYPFAVTKAGDTPEARALLTFIAGPEARPVFVQRGFTVE
jgi:molybdate transport system substrate-binding protein